MAKKDNTWLWIGFGTAVVAAGVGLAAKKAKTSKKSIGTSAPPGYATFPILDRVSEGVAKLPSNKAYSKPRDMKNVNSMVIHGMGFDRGTDPSDYYKVNAHFIILSDGQIVQLQPLERNLKASDGFNKYAISVEFAGNHRNTKGNCYKPEKFGCVPVTLNQIRAGRYLVDYLINLMPAYGGAGLQGLYAHRQSSGSRGNDPGPDLWYGVGEWASKNRGLYTGADDGYAIGDGKPIPSSWRSPSHALA